MPTSTFAHFRDFLSLKKGPIFPGAAALPTLVTLFFAQSAPAFKPFDEFLDANGQDPHVQIQAFINPEAARPGERFRVHIRVTIEENWHIYSMKTLGEDDPLNTKILFDQTVFQSEEGWRESPPKLAMDEVLQKTINTHQGIAEFNRLLSVPSHLNPGVYNISGSLLFRACDNKICTLQREKSFRVHIKILGKV